MYLRYFILILSFFVASCATNQLEKIDTEAILAQSDKEIIAGINNKHPATYMILASKQFYAGQKDEAVKWFYIGQIRYRAYLGANPDLPPSGDPALFASLMSTVGPPINEYAGGDVDAWIKQVNDALVWHRENPDDFLGKEQHAAIYSEVETGLEQLRDNINQDRERLYKEREKRGLENR